MSLESEKTSRYIMIGSDGLNIISSALYPYRKFVTNIIPDSTRRTEMLGVIVSLEARIRECLKDKSRNEWDYFCTTDKELVLVHDAVSLFIISIRYVIPESADRNEVIRGYRRLLKLLTHLIEAPEQTKSRLN